MSATREPFDRALDALRSQAWTTSNHNLELEEKLMQTFDRKQHPSGFSRHRTWIVAAAVVFAGGVGFAATGGAEMVRNWLVTVRLVGPDGQVVDGVLEPVESENGVATLTLENPDGGQTTLEVQQLDRDPSDLDVTLNMDRADDGRESTTVNLEKVNGSGPTSVDIDVRATAQAGQAADRHIKIKTSGGPDDLALMNDAAMTVNGNAGDDGRRVIELQGADGAKTMLDLLRSPEGGFDLEHLQSLVDSGVASDVSVDEHGTAVITMIDENGAERIIEIASEEDGTDGRTNLSITVHGGGTEAVLEEAEQDQAE